MKCVRTRQQYAFVREFMKHGLPWKDFSFCWRRYMVVCRLHEMEVEEFFLYRLWRRELDEERYRTYIGWKKHINALVALNPPQYRCLTENKQVFHDLCKSYGISTPDIYGIYDSQAHIAGTYEVVHSVDELKAFLARAHIAECVIKPDEGTRGMSILILQYSEENRTFRRLNGSPISDDAIADTLQRYAYRGASQSAFLIQKRLKPHYLTTDLSRRIPFSYRVLTIVGETTGAEIIEVYGKAAVGDSDTDNWESGGLTIPMTNRGVCHGANDKAEYRVELMEVHPDHGFRIKGWQAPFFDEVTELAMRAARSFRFARCVAWDIVVAEDGLFVIEGNNPWGVSQQETYDRGLWQGAFARESAQAMERGVLRSPWC